jgi:heme A synthase
MNNFKSIFQSIGAVLAGYLVSAILTGVTIAVLGVLFPESYTAENIAWVIFNVIYGCAFAVIGGYVVARLAPMRPLTHATVLGVLMAIFALITGYAMSSAPPSPEYVNQPGWYYPVLAITVLPSILLGAWLYIRGAKKHSFVRQNI